MKKLLSLLLALVMVLSLVACGGGAAEDEGAADGEAATDGEGTGEGAADGEASDMKILISVGTGGLGDGGYNDSAYAGALKAAEEFGFELEAYEPKSISEAEVQLLACAEEGTYDLILGIGYDNASAVEKAAEAFPDQKFCIYQAISAQPNVLSSNQAIEDTGFIVGAMVAKLIAEGALAGVDSSSHTLGLVIAMSSGEINKQVYAMIAGGRTVDPEFDVVVNEIGSWSDTAKAKELATALYEKGCKVITHYAGAAGDGIFEAAKEIGFYVVGANGNQNAMYENTICSNAENMEAVIYKAVAACVDGTFEGGEVRYGLADDAVYITYEGSSFEMPAAVQEYVDDISAKIIDGTIVPPVTEEELAAFSL